MWRYSATKTAALRRFCSVYLALLRREVLQNALNIGANFRLTRLRIGALCR